MQDQIDYRAVQRRVEAQMKERKNTARPVLLTFSLCALVIFTLIGWLVAGEAGILQSSGGIVAMVVFTLASLASAFFQLAMYSLDTKSGEAAMREQLVTRELSEALLKLGAEEEAETKRKRAMRLTEDGELVEIADDGSMEEAERPDRYLKNT